jgi:hypothetical protein
MIEAGTGVIDITPNLGAPLAGSFSRRPAETVERSITVRSLVISNESNTIALVLCDLVCVPGWIVKEARTLAVEATGIPAENILVSATHTHYAPAPTKLLSTEPDPVYLKTLPQRIADSIAIAWHGRRGARIAHGAADTQEVCFNRRYRMKDGTVVFNPGVGNPDIIEPSGPVDPQVTALLVEDLDGKAIALWACLSLHYVGVGNEHAISPDYFGDFADLAARWLGDDCVGFLTNGTSGQVNNVDVRPHEKVPHAEQRRRVASVVAGAAIQATLTQPRTDEVEVRSAVLPQSITRRRLTADDIALANCILAIEHDDDLPREQFSYVRGQSIPETLARQYAAEAIELSDWPESIASEVQVIQIGDFGVVALPGEMFCEFGLALKAASPRQTTAVVSLANDYIGYCPTLAAFSEGAYETWAAKSAWPAPGTGEAMVESVVNHWNG